MQPRLAFLLACSLLQSSALQLPTQTTTAVPSSKFVDTDEPFTTKRNAQVIFDMPAVTHFPLPVVNSEVKPTRAATATFKTSGKPTPPRVTAAPKQQPKPTAPPPPSRRGTDEVPLYRYNSPNGKACILLQVDALITVKYKTKLGEIQEADIYVPAQPTIAGSCDDENEVSMSLKWESFNLRWIFAKTPGGERWYVEKIELTFNSSDKHFEHPAEPGRIVRLSTAHKHTSMMFPTPVGKSFGCEDEQEIPLTDGKVQASILLRDLKLQPFKFKSNDFAVEFPCSALSARAGRDETAPLAVGSTLAAAVLLTITGYAGWRHFKIKKVQYDTME